MELIHQQIDRIEDLLSKMDEAIDLARSVPFSNKVSIEKEALYGIIDDIRGNVYDMRKGLPSEINQARRVLVDKDHHIDEARHRAEMMIKAAENEAHRILDEHDLTVHAKHLAAQIVEDAKKEATDFKIQAGEYIINIFNEMEGLFEENLKEHLIKAREVENFYGNVLAEIQANRQSIKIRE